MGAAHCFSSTSSEQLGRVRAAARGGRRALARGLSLLQVSGSCLYQGKKKLYTGAFHGHRDSLACEAQQVAGEGPQVLRARRVRAQLCRFLFGSLESSGPVS